MELEKEYNLVLCDDCNSTGGLICGLYFPGR